ncbi:universal stress protein [Pedobacter sp. MC2016-14]|uniref:universal stress protein n=1 Tax=Pedobacter sp. MC2016-14 TaxID=2897327 RepID=UPI001E3612FD|nr:universal stress protein [Pedobacter sp. MC2016-14]MCD0487826.1 universal stress protein [Pedobacter sp. MC2016-14]
MKQLLVLSDFTANSAHAALMAVRLCEKLNIDLLLYHSVPFVPLLPDYNYGAYATEITEILFNESIEKLKKEVKILESINGKDSDYFPKINYQINEGRLENNLETLAEKWDISFVVMGGRSGRAIDHLLSGSQTAAVLRDFDKPILVIPEKAELIDLKKIIFATNFNASDITALLFLIDISQFLDVQIEVVHVPQSEYTYAEIEAEVAFRKYLDGLQQSRVSYTQIYGKHVGQRLQDYCEETGAAMLAMTRGHHNIISRLFGHSETKEVTTNQQVSVLIFPTAFTDK